jgi:predicted DNA binding CopG/RHH family protein
MIKKTKDMVLDTEENWYEDHADEFISASQELRENLIKAAKKMVQKTERMNIRMSKADMDSLKLIAAKEGLPYQSLVASILHKFTLGQLVDINEVRKVMKGTS